MTFALADKPSRIGLCHGCDAPCYERIDYFPSNHARAGEPMRVHGLKADARIAEFLLSDGSTMNSVLCAGCAAEVRPDDYPAIMRRFRVSCEEAMDDLRLAKLNAKPWPEERKAKYRARYYGLWIVGMLWKLKRNGKGVGIALEAAK